jgi:sugar lactone lactonase YvrE
MTKRISLTLLLFLASAEMAAAQDMPLSQILVEGEGWKEQGPAKDFKAGTTDIDASTKIGAYRISGDELFFFRKDSKALRLALPGQLVEANGIVLWPDGGTLVVGDAGGKHLWAFRVEKDGSVTNGDRYYALKMKPGEKASHVTALTVDDKGRLYAATPLGIQIFDPTGRLSGVIQKPADGPVTGMAFGGDKGDQLQVAIGDKLYARKMQGKSAVTPKPK